MDNNKCVSHSTGPIWFVNGSENYLQLASHGIKVRDFAYESTIKPVTSVRRVPVQVQPHLKLPITVRRETTALTRVPTEPILDTSIDDSRRRFPEANEGSGSPLVGAERVICQLAPSDYCVIILLITCRSLPVELE
jgi:hypothetical protein